MQLLDVEGLMRGAWIAALGFLASATTWAEDPSVAGQLRFRSETSDRTDGSAFRSFTGLRARLGVRYGIEGGAFALLQPQFSKQFGEPVFVPSSATVSSSQDTSGATYDPGLSIHQAMLGLPVGSWNETRIGRQELAYGDELLIGALDWSATGRSFDAIRSRSTWAPGCWVDLFGAKLQDNNVSASSTQAGDRDFYGAYASFEASPALRAVEPYFLHQRDATTATGGRLYVAGLRIKSDLVGLDYRAELTREWSFANSTGDFLTQAYQGTAEVGYVLMPELALRVAVEAAYASADFNQLYPTAHKWLGFADLLGRRNIASYAVHLGLRPAPSLKLQADFHGFARAETTAPAYKLNGVSPLGSAAGSGSREIATELDVTASYGINAKLAATAGVALVFAGAYLKDQMDLGEVPSFWFMALQQEF